MLASRRRLPVGRSFRPFDSDNAQARMSLGFRQVSGDREKKQPEA
jgi:hypothetical protein